MVNAYLKCMETREELLTTCNPKVMSIICLSAPDATSIYHCLKNKQLQLEKWFPFQGKQAQSLLLFLYTC